MEQKPKRRYLLDQDFKKYKHDTKLRLQKATKWFFGDGLGPFQRPLTTIWNVGTYMDSYGNIQGPTISVDSNRLTWCDEVEDSGIDHTGWFSDSEDEEGTADSDGDKLRGFIWKLAKNRGYIVGWSMGNGMCMSVDYSSLYKDADEAARAADNFAKSDAEDSVEYSAKSKRDEREAEEQEKELDSYLNIPQF